MLGILRSSFAQHYRQYFASFLQRSTNWKAVRIHACRFMRWVAIPLLISVAVLIAWWSHDLPSIDQPTSLNSRSSITLLDRYGKKFAEIGDIPGEALTIEQLPPSLVAAVVATEDRRFASHFGIDPIGLIRALFRNLRAGRVIQGGSTITQQLAKQLFLTPDRTLRRKVQEVFMALALERRYSKGEILSIYLNRAYFGSGATGVDAAAHRYFGKSARQVNLLEAAMLAGLLKAPSRINPVHDHEAAESRAHQVIANMIAAGVLTVADGERAKMQRLPNAPTVRGNGGWVGDLIVEQARAMSQVKDRNVTILTTLDASVQHEAEQQLAALLNGQGRKLNADQGAIVMMSPDGAIQAMVGGKTYVPGGFNHAVDARRQPGSAFKPFVFLAAVESGLTPDSLILDAPVNVGNWNPANHNGSYQGMMPLHTALAQSTNTVAVRLAEKVGIPAVVQVAHRLGIESPLRMDASLALGASEVTLMELTTSYAPFANGGHRIHPYYIQEIRAAESGAVLWRKADQELVQVIESDHLTAMNTMLADVVANGTGTAAAMSGHYSAGKTGTSQGYRDAWFVGYTAGHVAGVWLGNDDNRPMLKVVGGNLPAKLWHDLILQAQKPPLAVIASR